MITQELLKEYLYYNPDTGIWTWIKKPNKNIILGSIAGAPDKDGYIIIGFKSKRYKAHRLAWFYVTGKWPIEDIDHEDTNPSNNKWCNLREATLHQNNMHKSKKKNKKYKCIYFEQNRWVVRMTFNGKDIYLGRYKIEKEAVDVYNEAAKNYHGEFAILN